MVKEAIKRSAGSEVRRWERGRFASGLVSTPVHDAHACIEFGRQ